MAVSKQDLAESAAEMMGISKKRASELVNHVFETITDALEEGEDVSIAGFGIFKQEIRKARNGRNPKTGESLKIPEKKIVKFKLSSVFSKVLND